MPTADHTHYYNSFLKYCENDKERELLEVAAKHGQEDAAKHFGVSRKTIFNRLQVIRERATTPRDLVGNLDTPVPSPMAVKGTSTLYDAETGEAKISWIKTDVDKEQQLKQIIETTTKAVKAYKPLKRVKTPKGCNKEKLVIYPMGDPHIGMYAWSGETGEDFDCDIAERNLREAMRYLVSKTPDSEVAIILNLGDFFHTDNSGNTTTRGTNVDVDGRWSRVLEIGITLMIDCVNMALERHKKIIIKNNIGNHDQHTSQVLSICMRHAFKDNPRVEIAEPADKFFVYEFGKNLIFSTHGDGLKPKQAQGFVANAYSEIWGRTDHRYAYFGHFHHEQKIEENGLVTEIFNTLASSDAWHHASGYRSKRNMKAIVLDKIEGEVERYTFNLSRKMLQSHNETNKTRTP